MVPLQRATETRTRHRRVGITTFASLLIGFASAYWILAAQRVESIQRRAVLVTVQVTKLVKLLDGGGVQQRASQQSRRTGSQALAGDAKHGWQLHQKLYDPASGVGLTDFRANAPGSDSRKLGYALSLRGPYPAVIALTEQVLEFDAEMALLDFSCSVGPNIGLVDCSLTLERWVQAEPKR